MASLYTLRYGKDGIEQDYNPIMQRRLFWLIAVALSLVADFTLPFWWGVAATVPIFALSWWIVYRSDWF
jgi:uncharacterized membrane protein